MSLFDLFFGQRRRALSNLPGPTPRLPFGTAGDFFGKKPWEVCAQYGQQFGGCTLIWLGPKPAIVLNDADLIGRVLDAGEEQFYKKAPRSALLPVITDEALFLANGEKWAGLRSGHPFCQHFFEDWLPQQVSTITRVVEQHCEGLKEQVHAPTFFRRMAFDAFSECTIGQRLPDSLYRQWVRMGDVGNRRMTSLLSFLPPFSWQFYRARSAWYRSFESLITERALSVQEPGTPQKPASDLLTVTLRAGFELQGKEGPGVIDFTNVYMGGCFSASTVIILALHFLANNHESMDKLSSELSTKLDPTENWQMQAIEECEWLEAVLRETMRFLSPVPLYFRNSNPSQSIKLGDAELPPDTMVFITNRYLHRDGHHWHSPDQFTPSRWTASVREANPLGSGHFFPFGRGPRMCVGMDFAMLYMKIALATIIAKTRLHMAANQEFQEELYFGVVLPKGLWIGPKAT